MFDEVYNKVRGDFARGAAMVAVSGGLDPIHIGHYRMLKDASEHGIVVVILNSDEWLKRKKGYALMPFEERQEILECCMYVDYVVPVDDSDGTVCEALRILKPDFFANGGDRNVESTPEVSLCKELGIKMLWNVGGEKIQSSSALIDNVKK